MPHSRMSRSEAMVIAQRRCLEKESLPRPLMRGLPTDLGHDDGVRAESGQELFDHFAGLLAMVERHHEQTSPMMMELYRIATASRVNGWGAGHTSGTRPMPRPSQTDRCSFCWLSLTETPSQMAQDLDDLSARTP